MFSRRGAQSALFILALVSFIAGAFAEPSQPLVHFVGACVAAGFLAAAVLIGDAEDFADDSRNMRHARAAQRGVSAPTPHL